MKPSAVVFLAAAFAALLAPSATAWLFFPPLPPLNPFFPLFPWVPPAPSAGPPPSPPPPPMDDCTRFFQVGCFDYRDDAGCCRFLTQVRHNCSDPVIKTPGFGHFVDNICRLGRTPPPPGTLS